jgi:hypothetical protein
LMPTFKVGRTVICLWVDGSMFEHPL